MFRDKINKIVEVYIDDMVVKSKKSKDHVQNLAKIFEILRHHKLRLNARKCSFEVGFGKFLRYMITCKVLMSILIRSGQSNNLIFPVIRRRCRNL